MSKGGGNAKPKALLHAVGKFQYEQDPWLWKLIMSAPGQKRKGSAMSPMFVSSLITDIDGYCGDVRKVPQAAPETKKVVN
jgi:hypothetical protein